MTSSALMPQTAKQAARRALVAMGYRDHLIDEDYPSFLDAKASSEVPREAPLVAFWDTPLDQSTSAIAVHWVLAHQTPEPFLREAATGLWAPFTLLGSPQAWELWETLPTLSYGQGTPFKRLEQTARDEDLLPLLAGHRSRLEPQAVAARKRPWRQMALYEASPESNAFMRWAYEPTFQHITQIFGRLLREAVDLTGGQADLEAACLRWVLRMVGVRLLWDKRLVDDAGSPASPQDIFLAALRYPTRLAAPDDLSVEVALSIAAGVVDHLSLVNLRAVDRGVLSQVIQGRGLPLSLVRGRKICPTPSDVAWRMLANLPIETIPEAQRRVWDGTCGTGTFLVAAVDRLRDMMPHLAGLELRTYLTSAIGGNEIEPALADATRIALDQAVGAPLGPEWRITQGDLRRMEGPAGEQAPSIIASNPPFQGDGRVTDVAVSIIGRYVEMLPAGGLMAVVAPRTMLATDTGAALRRRLLLGWDVLEVWELAGHVFPRTDTETAVILAKRRYQEGDKANAVTWRVFDRKRSEQWLDAAQQQDWVKAERSAIRPPLAMRLEAHFGQFPRLLQFVPEQNRSQGITPGTQALRYGDVLDHYEDGAESYLVGRTDMLPFSIPWQREPRWIRYDSPRLQWPRRAHVPLFRGAKVLVSRHATRGATWRIRAAVDRLVLFPSDQFVALKPTPPMSLEFVAGLLNSVLANAWLRLVNPAFSTRLDDLLALPVPRNLYSARVRDVEQLAGELATVWSEVDSARRGERGDLASLLQQAREQTLQLDAAIYDLYDIPLALQREFAEYLRWLGGSRPGFQEPVVGVPPEDRVPPIETFSESDGRRMAELFGERRERSLSEEEEAELSELVHRLQRVQTARLRRGPLPARNLTNLRTRQRVATG